MALGVSVSDLFNTLQVYLGSYYVNNFNQFGRTWQVNLQADPQFRKKVPDIRELQVRNNRARWSGSARCSTCATRAGR